MPQADDDELLRQLLNWNNTTSGYPRESTLHGLFSGESGQMPGAPAVVGGTGSLTYGELDSRSSQLARALVRQGVTPGTRVGLCLERSEQMPVGMLGILKAGAAYVPLDADYPSERLAFMLEDTGAVAIVTQASLRGRLPGAPGTVLSLDEDEQALAQEDDAPLPEVASAGSLAYIIYTSGSTGKPKGVAVPHRAVVRLVRDTNYIDLQAGDRVVQASNVSFDAATFEFWGALLNGGELVVAPRETTLNPKAYAAFLRDRKITSMFITTALFNTMAREAPGAFAPLRDVMFGGELVDTESVRRVLEDGAPQRLLHVYGPTESTTFASWHLVDGKSGGLPDQPDTVPIGKPLANTTLYVLDRQMQPVRQGEAGELYVGGDGLAQGYWQRPELTAAAFVAHPFSGDPEARLYRTGDRVRQQADGSIIFVGRFDDQVKIRGFRIEPGEVEKVLQRAPGVREASVMCRDDGPAGERRLVGYVSPETVSVDTLRTFMRDALPVYMVPSAFVALESLPLTANGKVDRKALPAPELFRQTDAAYVAPGNLLEEKLAGIWGEVLGVESPGMEDRFFDLGGHSLSATQIISRIYDAFQVELPFAGFFENPSLAQQAAVITSAAAGAAGKDLCPIPRAPRDEPLPLSFSQERVWFLQQLEPDSMAYYFQGILKFNGPLDVDVLRKTLDEIIRRHESLRTTFHEQDGRPVQRVHPPCPAKLIIDDLRTLPETERDAEAVRLVEEEIRRPCQLTALPLVRWKLMQLDDSVFHLAHIEHHLIHDGWSFNVFLDEFLILYRAYTAGETPSLPELDIQFGDFTHWQHEWMKGDAAAKQLAYWKKQLSGNLPVTQLPYDRPRPAVQSFRGGACRHRLPLELLQDLRMLGQRQGTTLFTVLMSGMIALLQRYSGQDEVCVGTGIANRRWRETERLIGMVINNLVLRAGLSESMTVRGLLQHVHEVTLDAYANQDMPFDKVVEAVAPRRDLSMNPLFQVLFAMHGSPMTGQTMPGIDMDMQLGINNGSAKFDLTINVLPDSAQHLGMRPGSPEDGLTFVWEYSADLFEAETVDRIAGHYEQLLRGMADSVDARVAELPMMTDAERHRTLVEFNDTQTALPAGDTVQGLFEAQAARHPDSVALEYEGQHFSYRGLNARANRLAHYLRGMEVGPGSLVGICLERSPDMLISMLGTLKAGGAYVPIDPMYPETRLAFMFKDAAVSVLLSHSRVASGLPDTDAHVVCLDTDQEKISAESSGNPEVRLDTSDRAYVIYTSGSTGTPKGVMVPHRALYNFLCSMRETPGLAASDGLLAVTTLSFDIAALELYLPLITGARVVLADRKTASDPTLLKRALAADNVTVMQATPATWRMLKDAGWEGKPQLRVFSGGEALPPDLAEWLRQHCATLWNLYGPTETTIWSTAHEVGTGENPVSIGRPIANTRVFVLDKARQPLPAGVPGELYIGGDGLANGYLNRSALTAERFIEVDLPEGMSGRLYRSGDLARLLPDGRLECLGRIDHQVKLRGFRIELGEIETVLGQHPQLQQAIVLAREDIPGEKRLVAYVVPQADETLPEDIVPRLRESCREQLPDYMVPATFVLLEDLPLTPNGKVDRQQLPAPDASSQARPGFVEPESETQQTIAEIWQELLHLDRVGLNDSFFELGGHSLLATQVASRLRSRFNLELPLAAVFENATLAALSEHLESLRWLVQGQGAADAGSPDIEGGVV